MFLAVHHCTRLHISFARFLDQLKCKFSRQVILKNDQKKGSLQFFDPPILSEISSVRCQCPLQSKSPRVQRTEKKSYDLLIFILIRSTFVSFGLCDRKWHWHEICEYNENDIWVMLEIYTVRECRTCHVNYTVGFQIARSL